MAATAIFKEFTFDTGVLAAGWKMYHYVPGTTTNKNVWLDRGKVNTAADPLVADANGLVSGYFDGLYDLVVKDADDVLKYTWEDVYLTDIQSLGIEGTAIASAGTLTLGDTQEIYYHITGTTTIENISGSQAFVILTFDGACALTHDANDFVLAGGSNRTTYSGETVMFVNDGAGVWREVGMGPRTGSWTPTLTCATPGDLNVAYTTQLGRYTRDGKQVTVTFDILTSTFTHGTASGDVSITGLPFTAGAQNFYGSLWFGGITKANYTQFSPAVQNGTTTMLIEASGSGQAQVDLAITDMPTGGTVALRGSVTYETAT